MFFRKPDPAPPPRPFDGSIESLVENELDLEHGSIPRAGQNRLVDSRADRVGLALSGGGIRSATFNLGLLQGLHDLKLLDGLSYLSTVSGGGYVGSFWTAWRSRPESNGRIFPEPEPGAVESPEIRHLREFGGFLAPKMGVLSWDTGRLAVAFVSALVPAMLAAVSVIALVFVVWATGMRTVFGGGTIGSMAVLVGGLAALLLATESLYARRKEPTSRGAYVIGAALALGVTAAGWSLLRSYLEAVGFAVPGTRLPAAAANGALGGWGYLFLPSLVFIATAALFSLRRWVMSRFERGRHRKLRRAAFDRVHGQLLLASASSAVVAGLWVLGALAHGWASGEMVRTGALGAATAGSVGGFAYLHRKLNDPVVRAAGRKLISLAALALPRFLAYAAVILLVASTVATLIAVDRRLANSALASARLLGGADWGPLVISALACSAVVLGILFFMDPNEVGLHAFYKSRIARTFPGASNARARSPAGGEPDHHRRTEEQPGDDLRFARGPTPTGHTVADEDGVVTSAAPVHLVCCAANDLAADPVATLNRGATSAVLSHAGFSVGNTWAPWHAQIGAPTLAHAATASGAAFNSLMGAYSVQFGPAATFLMAALNLRLGMWLPHPRAAVHLRKEKRLKRWLIGLPFFKEMAGMVEADGQDVHLSDGGHFENLGVYELIRRHCRFVIASDSSADPTVGFNDFGNLVRRVREDFGVDVRIDLSPLRPDPETGLARQSMVAGDIHYPEGDTGVLLLIKPSITGTEPADIVQYRARNPVFPHQSTVDQFFDESQWESYRRLGQHIVESAFRPVAAGLDPRDGMEYVRQLLARARREWQPRPAGFEDRLGRLTDRVARLDAALRQAGCEVLLRQVYRELDFSVAPSPGGGTVDDPAAAAEGGTTPSGRALATTLHVIRLALMTMDEVFESEDLERNFNHPLYLGVMNYFARWAYAPLVRFWWPLLKSLHPQPFTRFVEERFGLAGPGAMDDPDRAATIAESVGGFAWDCWRLEGREVRGDQRVISYHLRLPGPDADSSATVQAAQVVGAAADGVLAWDADDFYVPPGLWGIGIGEDFLRRLAGGQLPFGGIRRLCVRVRTASDGTAAAKRAAANLVQLYRAAGFTEAATEDLPTAAIAMLAVDGGPAGGPPDRLARWMVRDITARIAVPLQAREGVPEEVSGRPARE